jgi:hypothetical protein
VSDSGPGRSLADLRQRAGLLVARGAFVEACVVYEELRSLLASQFGETTEPVAKVIETMAGVARQGDDLASARRHFERAREIYAIIDPSRVPSLDTVLGNVDRVSVEELARRPVLTLTHHRPEHRAGGPRAVIAMVYDQIYIGRGIERVHLFIHSPMLSRIHARVLWRAPDAFVIEDCRSENGTLFEGQMIDRRVIRDADVYMLGGTERLTCRVVRSRNP